MIKKAVAGVIVAGLAVHGGVEVLKHRHPGADERSEALHNFAKDYFLPALLGNNAIIAVGVGNIPSTGPFMAAPSHTSYYDHFVIPHVLLDTRPDIVFRFMAMHQLSSIPYIRDLIEGTVVYVNRKSDLSVDERDKEVDELTMLHAQRIIDVPDGNGAGITYPWSGIEKKGTLKNIGTGVIQTAAHMATMTGIEQPILPIGAQGHQIRRVSEFRVGLRHHAPAAVSIGEPIFITPDDAKRIQAEGRRGEIVGRFQGILRPQIRHHTLVARGIAELEGDYPERDIPSSKKSQKNTQIDERRSKHIPQG